MNGLSSAVTALCALLGGLDVAGLDARGLREVLQREVYAALGAHARLERAETDADVRLRALRQARAIDAAWALVRFEIEVELGERRRVA